VSLPRDPTEWFVLRTDPIHCDLWFLLEIAGVPWLPSPHGDTARAFVMPARLTPLLGRLRDEGTRAVEQLEAVLSGMDRVYTHAVLAAKLASVLGGVDVQDLTQLISEATQARGRAITISIANTSEDLVRQVFARLRRADVQKALASVGELFRAQLPAFPITVVPYPLAAYNTCAFGSLTGQLITLGVHPHSTADQLLGIIVHELVHACMARRIEGAEIDAAAWRRLEEPLATSIGVWTVQTISGNLPVHPWYDDAGVDQAAKAIFPHVAQSLAEGRSLDSVATALVRAL
jgi:hypothetical protein